MNESDPAHEEGGGRRRRRRRYWALLLVAILLLLGLQLLCSRLTREPPAPAQGGIHPDAVVEAPVAAAAPVGAAAPVAAAAPVGAAAPEVPGDPSRPARPLAPVASSLPATSGILGGAEPPPPTSRLPIATRTPGARSDVKAPIEGRRRVPPTLASPKRQAQSSGERGAPRVQAAAPVPRVAADRGARVSRARQAQRGMSGPRSVVDVPEARSGTEDGAATAPPMNGRGSEPPPDAADMDRDALHERAFGGRPRREVHAVHATILADGTDRGPVLLLLNGAGVQNPRLDGTALLEQVGDRLAPEVEKRLRLAMDDEGFLELEDLRAEGLEVGFDEAELSVLLGIPAALRRTDVTVMRRRNLPEGLEDALRPSPVSGYVNLRGGMGFVQRDPEGASPHREPVRATADGALNVLGWVLESEARYGEDSRDPWMLNGVRLVKDHPGTMLRFTLGDLAPPYRGHLQGRPMGGFSVARNFALQPYRVTHPISRYEFFLERRSQVHVWVGERLVQTLQLDAGRHDLRDLPLVSGINDVRLQVIDEVGREEMLEFDAVSYAELLEPGLQQFAYSIGFPSRQTGALREYKWERPMLLAFHRVGVLDSLTLGTYLQADFGRAVAGIEGLWASPIGLWGFDVAAGSVRQIARSYALSLRYRNLPTASSRRNQRAWSASFEVVGPGFVHPGGGDERPYRLGVSASYGQRLFWGIHGAVGGAYRLSGMDPRHSYNADLTLSRRLWRGAHLSVTGSQRGNSSGVSDQRVVVNLVWQLPGNHTLSDSFDSLAMANRLSWNYGSPRDVQAVRAWGDAIQTADGGRLGSGVSYTGYRGEARYTQNVAFPDLGLRGHLSAGTALVFAQGVFGVSRPVGDSFAMVVPTDKRLFGRSIRINDRGGHAGAKVDVLGPGILAGMRSYHLNRLELDVPDLPFGHDVGQTRFALLPTYRSGYLFRLGVTTTVFVTGILVDSLGDPISLKGGVVVAVADNDAEPTLMFTNRQGRFSLDGLQPGTYELRLITEDAPGMRFVIPEDREGLFDIGTLRMPPFEARIRQERSAGLTRP